MFRVLYLEPYTVELHELTVHTSELGIHKFRMPGRPSDKTVDRDGQYLWVLSMELAACHPCGIQDFAVAPRFLEIVWVPVLGNVRKTNRNEVVRFQKSVM